MIDLHTHVLPGVDDGARSLEEALDLCRRAAEDGTTVIVATPHSGGREGMRHSQRPGQADVDRWTAEFQVQLEAKQIPLQIVAGMEIYVERDLLERPEQLVPLGSSRAVLLELPADAVPLHFDDLLFQLQVRGYTPVIAHPERNLAIMDQPELLYGWVSRGCLAQVTAMSLLGAAGSTSRSVAERLVEADLIHVIASDAHWFPERPTGLSEAVARAAELTNQRRATAMVTSVPEAILAGQPVTGFQPKLPTRAKQWWRFW